VHALSKSFKENCESGWGLLLTDAENAFNSTSRPVFLWGARIIWPRGCRFLFNSYRGYPVLVIRGSNVYLSSQEGCTQGSGLAMQAYAIGNLPLIRKLKNPEKWIQNWYADDGSCLGKIENLLEWLNLLMLEGPKHGYFNEISKNKLIVAPIYLEYAQKIFHEYDIEIITGHRILGGFVGSKGDRDEWIRSKTDFWVQTIKKLSAIAKHDPHSAFLAVSKSLQNEWNFLQRVSEVDAQTFSCIKETLIETFIPEICGFKIQGPLADLMLQPARFGGIGIRDPVKTYMYAYTNSMEATTVLVNSIVSGMPIDIYSHSMHSKQIKNCLKKKQDEETAEEIAQIIQNIPDSQIHFRQHLSRITSYKCSAWLQMCPWEDDFFFLHPDEFRDSMACRYGQIPRNLQPWCDGCGANFDVNHALDCKNGGLVYQRHNEFRDENCLLNKKAGFSQVINEPVIKEAGENGFGELRGDWSVRGFWTPQRVAVFDTRIFNASAPSYRSLSLEAAFNIHRNQKKNIYNAAVESKRGSFTPIIATCEGILDREAEAYAKRLAFHLAKKNIKTIQPNPILDPCQASSMYSQIRFKLFQRIQNKMEKWSS
jgi:hypothetical protein